MPTDYGLDGPGSNPGGDEIFRTCPDRPWGPPSLLYSGYRVFRGGRGGRSVGLIPHPHIECRGPRKSRAIPLLTIRAFVAYKKYKNVRNYLLQTLLHVSVLLHRLQEALILRLLKS